MSQNHPLTCLPNALSSDVPDSRQLNPVFEAMILNSSDVAGSDFYDNWAVADTKEALALSFVNNARLK